MEENKHIDGELNFSQEVIEKIIKRVLDTVPGVLDAKGGFASDFASKLVNRQGKTDGVNAEVGKEEVAADLDLVVEYDQDVPAIVDKIKSLAHDEIKSATNLEVIEVNVNVVDIMTREEFDKKQVTVQDKLNEQVDKVQDKSDNGDAGVDSIQPVEDRPQL